MRGVLGALLLSAILIDLAFAARFETKQPHIRIDECREKLEDVALQTAKNFASYKQKKDIFKWIAWFHSVNAWLQQNETLSAGLEKREKHVTVDVKNALSSLPARIEKRLRRHLKNTFSSLPSGNATLSVRLEEAVAASLRVKGKIPLLWTGYGTKSRQGRFRHLGQVARKLKAYIFSSPRDKISGIVGSGHTRVLRDPSDDIYTTVTALDRQLLSAGAKDACKDDLRLWSHLSAAWVKAWTSKEFFVAFSIPVNICKENPAVVLCHYELPRVPADHHGVFYVANKDTKANKPQNRDVATCAEVSKLLEEMLVKFSWDCYDCPDAALKNCKRGNGST